MCAPCQVHTMLASWQVNERSQRSPCFFPGDTSCPHSVTIKSPTRCGEHQKRSIMGCEGERRHIKEWYWLQIIHVSCLISTERNRTAQRGTHMRCRDLAWWLTHVHARNCPIFPLNMQPRHLCDPHITHFYHSVGRRSKDQEPVRVSYKFSSTNFKGLTSLTFLKAYWFIVAQRWARDNSLYYITQCKTTLENNTVNSTASFSENINSLSCVSSEKNGRNCSCYFHF